MIHTGEGVFRAPQIGRTMRFEPTSGEIESMLLQAMDDVENVGTATKLAAFDVATANLAEYAGSYGTPELPVTYYLELNEGQLTLSWLKGDTADLLLIAEDLMVGDAGSLKFERGASGEVTGFVLDSGRVRNFRFERIR